jgi:transposase-like protein
VPRTRPPYPEEFKREAIEFVRISSKSQHQIAEELGISDVTLRNWVMQAERDEGERPDGLSSEEREELHRLRRENQRLRMEREILKKAAAFFAAPWMIVGDSGAGLGAEQGLCTGERGSVSRVRLLMPFLPVLVVERGGCARLSLVDIDVGETGPWTARAFAGVCGLGVRRARARTLGSRLVRSPNLEVVARARHCRILPPAGPARGVGQEGPLRGRPGGGLGRPAPQEAAVPEVLLHNAAPGEQAGSRFGLAACGSRGAPAAGDPCPTAAPSLPRAWGARGGRAVCPLPRPVHARLRRSGRVVGDQDGSDRDHEALRIDWETVGRIVKRVGDELLPADRLGDLFEISLDEVAWRKGHSYLTLVGDHRESCMVWGTDGKGQAAADAFFDALDPPPADPPAHAGRSWEPEPAIMVPFGPCPTVAAGHGIPGAWLEPGLDLDPCLVARASRLTAVSMDMTGGYAKSVREHAPQAETVIDNYHVAALATKALDEVRREHWNELRQAGQADTAKQFKADRWALLKNPDDLTEHQAAVLAAIRQGGGKLARAWTMKEMVREIFKPGLSVAAVEKLIDRLLTRLAHCRLAPFIRLGRTIRKHREGILAARRLRLSNARAEALNNKAKLIVRRAYGPLRTSRTRAHPADLRTSHSHPSTRATSRVTSPTIIHGEPFFRPGDRRGVGVRTTTWRGPAATVFSGRDLLADRGGESELSGLRDVPGAGCEPDGESRPRH